MSESKVPLLIIGGGIGGLTTALALAKRGRDVHVIERASEFGEIGAGIQIAPNASRVFDEIGVLADLHACAVLPARIVWMDMISGKRLTDLDLGAPFLERYTFPYMVLHRSDLLDVLLRAARREARITLETGRDVVEIVNSDDYVDVRCANGATYRADALVAADGLWSKGRTMIEPASEPNYDHFIAYRGAIPIASVSEHAGLDNVMLWSGPNRHFMQYPVRRGELFNQVAVFRSTNPSPNIDDWGGPSELDAAYADVCPQLQIGLALIGRDRHWVMADRSPLERWTAGRITLLGDSAHPMYQYAAQGACQAVEDASALAESMAREPDVVLAFHAYESARKLRTERVQRTARWFGDVMHLAGAGAVFRNQILASRSSQSYQELDFLYGYGTKRGSEARTIDDLLTA
jgi:2-polyprenyl-6-methoxyphenol hydroxylase-like FAD-dependent oxidoreductase